ncbi:MAG: RND family efflux transporter MFP subunit [Psychromonas sp.]|jgi:RND family efflux transporter MFP subunit|uniref:efflux RND transporter periplasmic adaptor subunit n=1 Tax=Psychromonas sp. TaxID=1884585 RepID=UPI0039E2501A
MKFKPSLAILLTLGSVACLAGAVTYNAVQMQANADIPSEKITAEMKAAIRTAQAPSVVVLEVQADQYQALVKGYGEAVPRYDITYVSEVSGRVAALMSIFETGNIVKKGDILAKLENTSYQQALAQAKSDLAQAQLDLLEEQRTGAQARLEWQRSGLSGEPNSLLVLRQPQLAAEKAAFENAQYSLKKAQQDLDKTVIKAPFDALIVERSIQPGSYLQAGSTIAELYSIDRVEINIPLSAQQWANLPQLSNKELSQKNAQKWPVMLYSTDSDKSWQGYVTRIELNVDLTSRQRSLIVAVDHPFDSDVGLFPGTFVQAHIEGSLLDNTWELPASAISQQGDLWFISEDNQLNKVAANKVFEKDGLVYVTPIAALDSAKIIKRPLSNYIVGMLVKPKVEG